jgi:LmbE family N-acetylglucosaminyl deacetylase
MKEVEYHDFILSRNEERNKQPWMPVPVEQFDSLYNTAEAYNYVAGFIEKHQPAVIFTLDDIMGGYGHPEHVLMSQMVIKYCQNHHQDSLFSVKRIYQAVFDPMMNEKILKDMDAFQSGKNVYGVSQSPNPDVYLSLEGREEIKKKAMLSYTTEQNSLTKIWPFYQYYPAKIYFSIFDKEYYRILTKEEGFHSDRENML